MKDLEKSSCVHGFSCVFVLGERDVRESHNKQTIIEKGTRAKKGKGLASLLVFKFVRVKIKRVKRSPLHLITSMMDLDTFAPLRMFSLPMGVLSSIVVALALWPLPMI